MTTPDPLEPAIEAGLTEVGRMLAGVPVDGEEATLADHVRAAIRAAAPIIAVQAERDVIRTWLDEALAQYSHQWTGGDDPDLADWLRERAETTDA